ncbi:MAG TPA: cytochrome c oxidase assembly protein [Rhizomicrobium sp.]|jgi:putative membrane protein|nr:cytochrome c oxidase assembly protein [Rhizomicrobium sp.]
MRTVSLLVAAAGSLAAVLLLSDAARQLFAAHMAQHLILICVTAPLLALVWPVRSVSPLTAWCLFVPAFLFWHWPVAFQWAAGAPITGLFELATILGTATLFWSVMLAPTASHGAAALYVMTAAIATDLPGVIMIFAPRAICTMPNENAARFGLTALEDQQMAGLLMWVPANIVFFSFATFLFARWMREHPSSLVTP